MSNVASTLLLVWTGLNRCKLLKYWSFIRCSWSDSNHASNPPNDISIGSATCTAHPSDNIQTDRQADTYTTLRATYVPKARLWTAFMRCGLKKRVTNHRLRGSASPVLTATGFVNGKGQFSTPHRIDTPQPITKNLSQMITSATPTAVPN